MNCQDFNKIIDELADHKPMQASIREASVSHVALCAACAGRLASARAVGSSLLLAASAESEDAPVRVKENLLAAFANHQRTQAAPANVVSIASRRPRWWAAVAAVAAVIVLAAVVSIWKNASAPSSPNTNNVALRDPAPTPAIPPVPDYIPVTPADDRKPRKAIKTRSATPRMLRQQTADSGSKKQAYESVAQNTGEFVPLTYLATSTAMDSGTIVRVELSRSALASLGFTANVEGSSDSVKADVILGDDGVARAIRLVE